MKFHLVLLTVVLVGLHSASSQTPVEAWVQRYNSPGDTAGTARNMAVDSAGNVVVAGDSSGGGTLSDWLIIKYSGAGIPLWTNRYNGPSNLDDFAGGVAVDRSGNVFVTGYSRSSVSFPYDEIYTTIAYSAAGAALWTNHFNRMDADSDRATAVTVDTNGNVFVTGNATIKYSGAGMPLWTNVVSGRANAIAVDAKGQVSVSGAFVESDGQGGDVSYSATISYSSAGVPLWTNRFSDAATSVAVDGSGNVFVTGSVGGFSGYDYATIAYSSAGTPLWTNIYNSFGDDAANAIAADSVGSVFVTGTSVNASDTGSDYATIKYSGGGVPLWTNRFHGPAGFGSYDFATALAVDGSGSVFVTGYSLGSGNGETWDYATIKYSGAGISLWTNRYDGPNPSDDSANDLGVDSAGNVFVTGTSGGSFATLKYSGAGVALWTNRFNDGLRNGKDIATGILVDGSGKVFVSGTGNNDSDYVTVQYSSARLPQWTNVYNGSGNGRDSVTALALDGASNVLVTGYSRGVSSGDDYATIKYSGAGLPLWTNYYNGAWNSEDHANAIGVDGSGNVFVTGYSWNGSESDYATIKYSGAGAPLWTNWYNGPGNFDDTATALAVDGTGNLFVTGYSTATNGFFDYATIKYSAAGVALWTNRYDGPAKARDVAFAIAVAASGTVFVCGYSEAGGTDKDFATIAYSSAGAPLWTNRYNGSGNYIDSAAAIAVDNSGDVIVTGSSFGAGTSFDYATIKYSGAGMPLWTNRYNGPANGDDVATSLAVEGNGNVCVTGYSRGNGSAYDYATVAYSAAGMALWTNRFNGASNGNDSPQSKQSLALGPNGSVYVTGASDAGVNGTAYDFLTVKYAPPPLLLTIVPTPTNAVVISWPSSATGFSLQASTNLSLVNGWSTVAATRSTNNSSISLALPATGSQKFFRLKSQ
jgi:uncharacterized delta-60 repeat protein